MVTGNPRSTAQIAGHPIHPMLIPFPVTFFVTTLVSDIMCWQSGAEIWSTVSLWLLGAGIVMALVAALFGFADYFGDRHVRDIRDAKHHMIGNLVVVVLQVANWVVRYQGGPGQGVLPILLSLAAVLLLLFTGWKGWELVYSHRVVVSERSAR